MDGRIVTQEMTPIRTPFAMTMPISSPSVKLMKQSAMNPAIVVMELPTIEEKVATMAFAMASFFWARVYLPLFCAEVFEALSVSLFCSEGMPAVAVTSPEILSSSSS